MEASLFGKRSVRLAVMESIIFMSLILSASLALRCIATRLTFILIFAISNYQPNLKIGVEICFHFVGLTTAFDAHLGWDFPCFYTWRLQYSRRWPLFRFGETNQSRNQNSRFRRPLGLGVLAGGVIDRSVLSSDLSQIKHHKSQITTSIKV